MSVLEIKKQTVYLGAGLTRNVWGVWSDHVFVAWKSDKESAQHLAKRLLDESKVA